MDEWSTTDIDFLNKYQLLTSKPVIVVNLTKKDYARRQQVAQKIHEWVIAAAASSSPSPEPSRLSSRRPRRARLSTRRSRA